MHSGALLKRFSLISLCAQNIDCNDLKMVFKWGVSRCEIFSTSATRSYTHGAAPPVRASARLLRKLFCLCARFTIYGMDVGNTCFILFEMNSSMRKLSSDCKNKVYTRMETTVFRLDFHFG